MYNGTNSSQIAIVQTKTVVLFNPLHMWNTDLHVSAVSLYIYVIHTYVCITEYADVAVPAHTGLVISYIPHKELTLIKTIVQLLCTRRIRVT